MEGMRRSRTHPAEVVQNTKMRSEQILAHSTGAVEYKNTLQRGNPPPNECPGYGTKKIDGEISVMLEVLRMWNTPSLPSLPGPLRPSVVEPDRALSMGLIELTAYLY